MSDRRFGRLTALGGEAVEREVTALVREAGELVERHLDRRDYRALVLLGGYGRGEGGVEERDGVERPHNNLDLLLITPGFGGARGTSLKRRLDELFRPLAARSGVGIDTGVIGELKLRTSPCLVMWFDMRFGHKTVAGDASLVPSLSRFRKERIEPADMLALLVNRGSLLVINRALLERPSLGTRPSLGEDARRTIVKHAMKAIIGYGDALLFAIGDYEASYLEKQRRMRARSDVAPSIRALYEEALSFRFRPRYADYLSRDLGAFMDDVEAAVEPIHLRFEAHRLGVSALGVPALGWEGYPALALRHALVASPRSPRALARKGKNLLSSLRASRALPGDIVELGLACNGPKNNLGVAFPAVLYEGARARFGDLAARIVGAPDASVASLRRAYLERWGEHGDSNFNAVAERLALGGAEVPS